MSRKEDEAFKAWGVELEGELESAEDKKALAEWLALPIAREVFRGTIGEKELYRRMNQLDQDKKEVEALKAELAQWYEEEAPKNASLIQERDRLKAELEALGSGGPPPAEGSGIKLSAEDLAEIKAKAQKVETLDKLLPAVLGDLGRVVKDSVKNDFDVDPGEVIKLSLQKGVAPWQAYLDLTSEERQKRSEAAREDERKKWFEEGRRAGMTNSPDHFQPSGPSVVDLLREMNKGAAAGGRDPLSQTDRVSAALQALQDSDLS